MLFMKNLLLILCLVAVSTAGCKKKDKTNNDPQALIVGKWAFNKIDFVEYINGNKTDEGSAMLDAGSYIEFKADKSFSAKSREAGDDSYDEFSGNYTLADNKLSLLSDEAGDQILNVKRLDKSTLTLESDVEFEDDGQIVRAVQTFYFSK